MCITYSIIWLLCVYIFLGVHPSKKKNIYIYIYIYPGIPTTIKTMGVNITTIAYLRVLIIENWVNHYFNGGRSPGYIQYLYLLSMADVDQYFHFIPRELNGKTFRLPMECCQVVPTIWTWPGPSNQWWPCGKRKSSITANQTNPS